MKALNVTRVRRAHFSLVAILSVAASILFSVHSFAQSVKVGRTTGGSGFHIPSYVAIDKGFLKAEGLDANFITATAGVLVRATIAKEIEFSPLMGAGSEPTNTRAWRLPEARGSRSGQHTRTNARARTRLEAVIGKP